MATTNENHSNEEWHARLAVMFAEIGAVAGFVPPAAMTAGFYALHKDLIETVPPGLAHLTNPLHGSPDWLVRFRHAVLTSVQEGLYASLYHLQRVENIETTILHIAARHAPSLGMPLGSGAGGGNSRALNCEYQAFAFAARRTLEYLSVAAAAYFKTDCHSIKRLGKAIAGRAPNAPCVALQELLSAQLPSLHDIIPDDKHNDRSLRDRLTHWESVPAGSFSISTTPWGYDIAVIGGGHDLPPFRHRPADSVSPREGVLASQTLGPVLREQYERVACFVFEVLGTLSVHVSSKPVACD